MGGAGVGNIPLINGGGGRADAEILGGAGAGDVPGDFFGLSAKSGGAGVGNYVEPVQANGGTTDLCSLLPGASVTYVSEGGAVGSPIGEPYDSLVDAAVLAREIDQFLTCTWLSDQFIVGGANVRIAMNVVNNFVDVSVLRASSLAAVYRIAIGDFVVGGVNTLPRFVVFYPGPWPLEWSIYPVLSPVKKGGAGVGNCISDASAISGGGGAGEFSPATYTDNNINVSGGGGVANTYKGGEMITVIEGRLSLVDGEAYPTSDVTGAGTVYLVPAGGGRVRVYDGMKWRLREFEQLELSVEGSAGDVFDVYLNDAADTLSAVQWTDSTTRDEAISEIDGIWVMDSDPTQLLLGSYVLSGTDVTESSKTFRGLCNIYNQAELELLATDSTDVWSNSGGSWGAANGASTNKVSVLRSLNTKPVVLDVSCSFVSNVANNAVVGVGVDTTTVNSADITAMAVLLGAGYSMAHASYRGYESAGYHDYHWIERCGVAAQPVFFFGDGGHIASYAQYGLRGKTWG